MARSVSSPAGYDKGYSPLTSAAFLKNCCTKKLLILLLSKNDFRVITAAFLKNCRTKKLLILLLSKINSHKEK
jgi:hypothetical protein